MNRQRYTFSPLFQPYTKYPSESPRSDRTASAKSGHRQQKQMEMNERAPRNTEELFPGGTRETG